MEVSSRGMEEMWALICCRPVEERGGSGDEDRDVGDVMPPHLLFESADWRERAQECSACRFCIPVGPDDATVAILSVGYFLNRVF